MFIVHDRVLRDELLIQLLKGPEEEDIIGRTQGESRKLL